MSEKKDEKWLDDLISRTIDSREPEFDAEKWKQKYPEEFQMLRSMPKQNSPTHRPSIWRKVRNSPITKIAAAVVIIVAIDFFIVHQRPSEQDDTTTVSKVTKSPVEMMTAISLERAFRRGGIEAVEDQCRKAFKLSGLWPRSLSFEQILAEFNGNKIYLVDGIYVRKYIYIDFLAGHYKIDPYIPKKEIWIDSYIPALEINYYVYHELLELMLMEKYKYSYEKAHRIVSEMEMKMRRIDGREKEI